MVTINRRVILYQGAYHSQLTSSFFSAIAPPSGVQLARVKLLTSENSPLRERFSAEILYHTVPVGLIGLQAPFLVATLISIVPMTGIHSGVPLILGGLIQALVFLHWLGDYIDIC